MKTMKTVAAVAAVMLTALGLAACSSNTDSSLIGVWGAPDVRGETSLEFAADGSYSGSDGCNRVMGTWEEDGERFAIAPMATTLMACQDVDVWMLDPSSVKVTGDTLSVLDADGVELGTLQRHSST